ncbi:MAG: hypothetical protein HQM16_10315 [Deltaproteobacteria bacterium]|nr:hypothetical protein [Deltaproteobacteria bacterium]
MTTIKIADGAVDGVFEDLRGVLGQFNAQNIVADGGITGEELRECFLGLKSVTGQCVQYGKCLSLFSRTPFDRVLLQAAGTDQTLDVTEAKTLVQALADLITQTQGQSFESYIKSLGISDKLLSAQEISKSQKGVDATLADQIAASTFDSPKFFSTHIKRDGAPSTVIIQTYIPADVKTAFKFIVGTADQHDDRTSLYEKMFVTSGVLPRQGQSHGSFETFTSIDLPYSLSEPGLLVQNNWSFFGSAFGPNAGGFIYRFGMVPGSAKASQGIKIIDLDGMVIARPTTNGGTTVELKIDFDFSLIPDFIIESLMTDTIKTFIAEISASLKKGVA